MKGAVDEPLRLAIHEPDEEDLRSFLLGFRQFVSDNEPVFFRKIANVLWIRLTGDEARQQLSAARSQFKESAEHGPMKLITDSHSFTPETALDYWIDGDFFHNDRRKRQVLAHLDKTSSILVRQIKLNLLVDTTRYITFLANVAIIGRREGLLQ